MRLVEVAPGYWVSDTGKVFSDIVRGKRPVTIDATHRVELQPGKCKSGHLLVVIRGKSRHVHKLVIEAFRGLPPNGLVTRHLNGIKDDNRIENLVYGTYPENLEDAWRHGYRSRIRASQIMVERHTAKSK